MPSQDRERRASELLWAHWREGRRMSRLPEELRPRSRREGYAIQALIEGHDPRPIFGWKLAATSRAGQAHIGVDGPLAGRLPADRVFASGASLPVGAGLMRVAEVEFAFLMGRDLDPRPTPYGVAETMDAVAALHPAIELPDTRLDDYARVGAPELIADAACADRFVLGPPAPASWRDIDLAAHAVTGIVPGRPRTEGRGANALGDPRIALAWLANELGGLGVTLRAGQVVTTGTCVVPIPIAPGDQVTGDFGLLGQVHVRLT